jgi:putative redox protein
MELTVEHLGAVQFEIRTRGHVVISDQPKENGGFEEGMTPPEFLLASLGSCAAYYAMEYLKARKLVSEGTKVFVTAEKAKNPARMDNFRMRVVVPVSLTGAQQEGVERAIQKCLVHNTLLHAPQIVTEVVSETSILERGAIGNQ